jgi:biopolymer transport protein ExbD
MTEKTSRPNNPKAVAVSTHARPLKLWLENSQPQDMRVEIIPLIDVVFCILTFFILAAVGLSRQQAISMNLPKASTGTPQMREMLVVSLDDMGQSYVEQQPVTRNQLYDAIKNYHQFNPNGLMVLHASKEVSYNEVIQVLDLLRQVGGDRVALATLPGEANSVLDNGASQLSNPAFPAGTALPSNPSGQLTPSLPTYPNSGLSGSPLNQTNQANPLLPGVPAAPQTQSGNKSFNRLGVNAAGE